MFDAEFNQDDLAGITAKLNGMLHRIDHFSRVEMGQIMSDWQTHDMHRKKPFTKRWRRKVQTRVRPHSLREMQRSKLYVRREKRHHLIPRHWSSRPILRAILESKLFTDMTDAFHRAIAWK